jgi:predicted amidohydrolase
MAIEIGRRAWLLTAALAALAAAGCQPAAPDRDNAMKPPEVAVKKDAPPRKVIIGTVCHSMYGKFPGIQKRCEELGALVDRMAAEANARYGRGLDLVVLSEFSLNDMSQPLAKHAVPLDSPGLRYFEDKARQHHTYLVIPSIVSDGGRFGNAAILLDRGGKRIGRYDKVHAVPDPAPARTFEGGVTPGDAYPVFDCDFGRIGIQICFDYMHEEGWRKLAAAGAELVVHPSQSPSVSVNAARAFINHVYVVSSTWRDNASILEPTGMVAAQIKPPQEILVHELDLEYRLLPWEGKLRDGAALREKYGQDVGFHYYPSEDLGIFWSNNPAIPIDAMVRRLGIHTHDEYVARARKMYAEQRKGAAAR